MKDTENNLKYGESSYTFKNIFNDYLNQHKKRKSQLELVLNPHKLFLEDLNKKRKKFDFHIDNVVFYDTESIFTVRFEILLWSNDHLWKSPLLLI